MAFYSWRRFAFVAAIVAAGELKMTPFLFTPAVAFAIWLARKRIPAYIAMREFKKLRKQLEQRDIKGGRLTLLDLRELYMGSPQGREQLRIYEASLLSHEAKYTDAATLLSSIDRKVLGPLWEPTFYNHLAWYSVLAGDAPGALEAARASIKSHG